MAFRVINIGLALLFLYATAVQYNDPDPALWMPIYGLAATAGFLAAFGRLYWIFPAVLGAGCLAGGLLLSVHVISKQPILGSEEGREMSGLFLVVLWMASLAFWSRNR